MVSNDLDAMAWEFALGEYPDTDVNMGESAWCRYCRDRDAMAVEIASFARRYAALRARAKGDEYEAHAKRCQGTRRITAEERALAFYRMADEEVENE